MHLFQAFDGVAKGHQFLLNPSVECRDRCLQLLDRLQMLSEQEPVMLSHAAMRPVRASTNIFGAQPRRSLPSAASLCASISPAIIAFNMRRPLAPKMSVITEQSLTLASSRTA